jgi:hypothetical protein
MFLLALPILLMNACGVEAKTDSERIYLGIAATSNSKDAINSSAILIRNAVDPISHNLLERKVPYYLHVEDLGREEAYFTLFDSKPKADHLINGLDRALTNKISTPKNPKHRAVIEGLSRIRTIINQDKSKGKIRASLVVSGFDIADLSDQELTEIKSVATDINSLGDRISVLCIVGMPGTPSRAKFAGLFNPIKDKLLIASKEFDQNFDKCLRK